MKSVVINLAVFKAAWAATVIGAAAGLPLVALIAAAIAAWIHLLRSDDRPAELRLLVLAAAIGFVWESALVSAGMLVYESGQLVPGFAPYWIVAMWVLFATTLNVGMRWLRRSTVVAAIAGAVGGPLAFVAGASAGAVTLVHPVTSLVVIGVGWSLLLPLLVRFAMRVEDEHPQIATPA